MLVRTGVYEEGTKPKFAPKHTADNVLEAVKFAMGREHKKSLREALDIGSGKLETTLPEGSAIMSPAIQVNGNPMEAVAVS